MEDAVAAGGEGDVVGDEDASEGVGAVQALDEGEDGLGGAGVEVAGGLVGEQDAGRGDEGAGKGDALLFASGELAGAVRGAIGKAYFGEPGAGFGERGGVGFAAGEQGHGYVLEGGELRHEVVKLPDVADVAVAEGGGLGGGDGGESPFAHPNLAGGGAVERCEEVEEGGFAGAGFADDGDHLAGSYGEGEVAKELEVGVAESLAGVGLCGGIRRGWRGLSQAREG